MYRGVHGHTPAPPSPAAAAEEAAREVRREFEASRALSDLQAIKYLQTDGRLRLKQVTEMVSMQR